MIFITDEGLRLGAIVGLMGGLVLELLGYNEVGIALFVAGGVCGYLSSQRCSSRAGEILYPLLAGLLIALSLRDVFLVG
jgi:hypothetical protein